LPQLKEFFTELNQIHGLTALVGLTSLAILLFIKFKSPKVPGALIVVIAGIAISAAADLAAHGVATVGHIPARPTPADVAGRRHRQDPPVAARRGRHFRRRIRRPHSHRALVR